MGAIVDPQATKHANKVTLSSAIDASHPCGKRDANENRGGVSFMIAAATKRYCCLPIDDGLALDSASYSLTRRRDQAQSLVELVKIMDAPVSDSAFL